jgi:hypothetical protein
MHRTLFLIVTGIGEGATGLALLAMPSFVIWLLLGIEQPAPETLVIARFTGAALLGISLACWPGKIGGGQSNQLGLLVGIFLYDVGAAALLAHAGAVLNLAGIALWPAVAAHAVLAAWCVACLRASR